MGPADLAWEGYYWRAFLGKPFLRFAEILPIAVEEQEVRNGASQRHATD